MTAALGQTARNLLEAPLLIENAVDRLGRAVWLYVRFLSAASYRGTVCRHIDTLAEDLHVTTEQINEWLDRLVDAHLVEIHSAPPYLVLKLTMWSGSEGKPEHSEPSAYSYSQEPLHKQPLKDSYRPAAAGAKQSANKTLLGEILETLGETDGASFEKAVELYSPSIIRAALQRVRRAQGIRKSRTALFRHLLPRIAQQSADENHSPDSHVRT